MTKAGKVAPPAGAPATSSSASNHFGSRMAFLLAAIGSAVGFGSIARFPMNAANNGGAMFLLMYLGVMVLVGIPMMIAEFSMGRSAQKNTVGAFAVLTGTPRSPWRFAGYFYFAVAAFVLGYYSILSGWTLRYLFGTIGGAYFDDPATYFTETAEGPFALLWHAVVMVAVAVTLTTAVSKGIEKVNLVMMPTLFAIIIGLAIYAATLDGVGPGYRFYLDPDLTAFTLPVFTAAIGQAFFSLSLAQGAMMTYAAYLSPRTSLATNASIVSLSTLFFAICCGFLIFPLLSSFGMLSGETAGLGLIFGPLAAVFAQMGSPVGNIVGTLFFLGVFFASFTSAVSLAEPAIAYVIGERKIDRRRASILVCGLIYIAGILVAFNTDILNFEGGPLTDVFIIVGGITIALFVGWATPSHVAVARMDQSDRGLRLGRYIRPWLRYALPPLLFILLIFSLLGTPCGLSGGNESTGLFETMFGAELSGCNPVPVPPAAAN